MKSRISSKGQVTVPAEVRNRLGLQPGTAVQFELRENAVFMRKGNLRTTSRGSPVRNTQAKSARRRPPGRDARTQTETQLKTALDSSVLLDVLGADPTFGEKSREALRSAYDTGAHLACDVVWAEVRAHFPADESCQETLGLLGVRLDPISAETAVAAGKLWRASRKNSRVAGKRVIADFLIGTHARLQADALLTRDRGFYRRHFAGLKVIDPAR